MESVYSSSSKELDHHECHKEGLVNLSLSISSILSSNAAFQDKIASPRDSILQPSSVWMLTSLILPQQPLKVPTIQPNGGDAKPLCVPGRRPLTCQTLRPGKSETIPAPYPWATTRRAVVHSLDYLLSKGINSISGEVECRKCEQKYEISYDLQQKFMEVAAYISKNKGAMRDRAPRTWMNPCLPDCKFCEQSNCVRPVLNQKRSINWLFLLLGEMLGCCKLSQLKYFCKHTKNHRTGAKDRVLYLTYLGLCKQLDPDGPFDRQSKKFDSLVHRTLYDERIGVGSHSF